MKIAALAVTALAAAGSVAAPAAAAPRVETRLAEVLSPRPGASVAREAMTVEVRLRGAVRSLSATVDGRPLRLTGGGRLRTATVRTAGLRAGEQLLKVRAVGRDGARDLDAVRFAVVRRHAPLLRVAAPRRAAGAPRVRLRLGSAATVLNVRLNGRAIDPPRQRGRARTLVLAADEGLRFGVNRLRIGAVDRARGRHAVVRRTIRVTRRAPIPGAGRDRAATVGRPLTLDGGRSRAARVPKSLAYRWRIVRKPRGSKATLRAATARRPRLTPDLPGRYRLRLTVSERMPAGAQRTAATRPGRRLAARAAQAPAATGSVATAADTTIADVTPVTPAVGLPLNTIAVDGDAMGIAIGERFYAAPNQRAALQLLVLDRATLELRSNSSYVADDAGTGALSAAVGALDDSALVIVSTPRYGSLVPAIDATALANVNRALSAIGATPLVAGTAPAGGRGIVLCEENVGQCAGFSAVGVPGLPSGQGTINPGLGSSADPDDTLAVGGALNGYLQRDLHGNFTYVSGEHIAFDTTAPGTTAQQAAIQVGASTYTSDALPAPLAGVYVLVLDAGSLVLRGQGTFALRYGPVDPLVGNMQSLTAMLADVADDPSALVFVQSIGRLARWDAYEGRGDLPFWWNRVAAALQHLGGHAMLFDALTDDGYTQVGPAMYGAQWGYPAPFTKLAGPKVTSTAAQLAGTLSRNENSQFHARNAAAVPTPTDDLPLVAYQPTTPWPLRDGAATSAAISCVAEAVDLPMPLESNYGDTDLSWGTRAATIAGMTYAGLEPSANCQPGRFAAADLNAVKAQLGRELTAVDDLRDWFASLKEPFTGSQSISPLKVAAISDAIAQSVEPPAQEPVRADGMAIAEDAFLILGALPGVDEATFGGPDLIASLIGLVGDTTTEPDGTKLLDYDPVAADELGIQIDESYARAVEQFDRIFAILVDDWGKLRAADQRQLPGQPWQWSDDKSDQAIDLLGYGAQRQAYDRLFPTVYDGLLRGTRGGFPDVPDDGRGYVCSTFKQSRGITTFKPFSGASQDGVQTVVVDAGPLRENWVFAAAIGANTDADPGDTMLRSWQWSPRFPSDALTRGMFAANVEGLNVPPLLPLPFALSIYGRTSVLTIRWDGAEDADGNSASNFCYGS